MSVATRPKPTKTTPGSSTLPPTRGRYVCDWIESNLVHGTGDFFARPFRLTQTQKRFIYRAYEQNPDGSRKYKRVLKGLPKGGGKTELAAALAVAELAAGLQESPDIPVAAATFEQADVLFAAARAMVSEGPLEQFFYVWDTEILPKKGPGRLYRVAAVAGANDGKKPSFFVSDELHEWNGNKERVHLVLANGLAKRAGGWELDITTAGHNKESLLGRMYDYGRRVESREVDDPSFLMDWLESDPAKYNLTDPADRERAVRNCTPDVDVFGNLASILRRYNEIPLFEWVRYYLDFWTESEEIWEVAQLWDDLKSPLELDRSKALTVGIDIGLKHDTTAVVMAQNIEGRIVLRARVWENPYPAGSVQHDKWILNLGVVKAFLLDLWREYPVAARERIHGPAFFFDPFFFIESAQDLQAEKLNMIEYPQRPERMIAASQGFFDLAKSGIIAHDGDETLRRHMRNVTAEQSPRGWRITKPKGSTKHIDAAIASAIAAFECSRVEPSLPTPGIRIITAGDEEQ